jgi:hypothetical protein
MPTLAQAATKRSGIVALVFRRDDEEAAGVLDTVGVGAAQDAVLLDALDGAAAGL